MAVSTVQTNNKLIRFTEQINREWIRENMFSPYMGEEVTSIIRRRMELKSGGEQMNIPLVTRLTGLGVSTGTLVGNEEIIDDYGMRCWIEWGRNAVVTNKSEIQKDSADLFGEAKPLLSDWLRELHRDETIAAMMALPSESQPSSGVRVNGIQYDLASAGQRDTWAITNNSDRIVYGATTANTKATHALSLTELDTTNDKFTATNLSLLKRRAMVASPRIRPYRTQDGYEHYVCFAGTNTFRDLRTSLETINKDARPRETIGRDGAPNNVLFQSGDEVWDGVVIRCVPEISQFVTSVWGSPTTGNLLLAGAGGTVRVEPVFLCGQQAVVFAIGQMAKPTSRDETDYQFVKGTGIEAAWGTAKMFKKHPKSGSKLVQWGVAQGFYATTSD